eukprot:SAG22_NODE_11006_length_505_cov_1.002463_2_plen_58_part_01
MAKAGVYDRGRRTWAAPAGWRWAAKAEAAKIMREAAPARPPARRSTWGGAENYPYFAG